MNMAVICDRSRWRDAREGPDVGWTSHHGGSRNFWVSASLPFAFRPRSYPLITSLWGSTQRTHGTDCEDVRTPWSLAPRSQTGGLRHDRPTNVVRRSGP